MTEDEKLDHYFTTIENAINIATGDLWPILTELEIEDEIIHDWSVSAHLFVISMATSFILLYIPLHDNPKKITARLEVFISCHLAAIESTYKHVSRESIFELSEHFADIVSGLVKNLTDALSDKNKEHKGNEHFMLFSYALLKSILSDARPSGPDNPLSGREITAITDILTSLCSKVMNGAVQLHGPATNSDIKKNQLEPPVNTSWTQTIKSFIKTPTIWKNGLAIPMLLLAMWGDMDYGYYTLLRIVIFLLALGGAWTWYNRKAQVWPWILIGVAILYNPIIKVSFDEDVWALLNILAIIIFIAEGLCKMAYHNIQKKGKNK